MPRSSILNFDPWSNGSANRSKPSHQSPIKGFNFGTGDFGGFFNNFNKSLIIATSVLILTIWGLSGFYITQPEEQVLELIFGKHSGTSSPGLHYNLPAPFGKIIRVKVATINREEIGAKKTSGSRETGEGVILTGDENIVNINAEILWKVVDPTKFVLNIREDYQGQTVKNGAESALRDAVGKNSMSFILSGAGRAAVSAQAQKTLQSILDHYSMGVSVVAVQLKKVDPPEKVIDAFRDVQSARSDKEREINEAEAYRNDKIPRAKGEAEEILQAATALKQEKIEAALGEAQRFSLLLAQYSKTDKELMKQRMYLDAVEEVLNSVDKIIIGEGTVNAYLPITELARKQQ